jgi:adenylate cyclase
MVTDIAGYSSLMESDEAATFVALGSMRGAAEKLVREHRGRIANTAGDSILAEFPSAVEAVHCALSLQNILPQQSVGTELKARIGIHLGDVLERNGDLFGTAINIAARLQVLAEPGGIVVSSAIRDAVAGKLPASITDLGVKTLKNIEEPVRVYALSASRPTLAQTHRAKEALPLPNKPSIAVLPFDDLSGEHDQAYFADGIVEEIITALSRFRGLFVIARNSSFAYKGRVVDVKQVGRELGVRYVLEGSVRKAGKKVRIAGQLIDGATAAHLWADRFDGELEDIFDLQDQVTARVVGAISPKLEQAEIERSRRKPTESLDAYDYYLRGMAGLHLWTKESNEEALSHFYRAIELDPTFASAYGMAARCFTQRKASGWMTHRQQETTETVRLARQATDLGREDAVAISTAGFALAYVAGELEEGAALIERALALNQNLAWAWYFSGWVKVYLGEPETAIQRATRAMRLSPNDTHLFNMQAVVAYGHFLAGRFGEAVSWAEMAVRERSSHLSAWRVLAASHALSGQQEKAHKAMARVRDLDPALRLSNLNDVIPFRPKDLALLADGLRQAGLPE